ncbi:DUF4397 domain-containing protein [Chitinophaga flava]|nr:DUF4397 domain-containing protein [Chitinophaga flava]
MKKLLIVALILLMAAAACKKNSDTAIPVTQSSFMFFNGVPEAVYDIRLDSFSMATGVAFGKNTPYQTFRAQLYTIYLIDQRFPNDTIRVGQINLRNKRSFSSYIGFDSANKVRVFRTIEDDLTPPPPLNMKFRVVDFSEAYRFNGTSVGIDVFSQNDRIFRGIGFTQFTPFVNLPGDSTYQLNFPRTDSNSIIPNRLPFPVQTGKIYTLVTVGNAMSSETFKTFTITNN